MNSFKTKLLAVLIVLVIAAAAYGLGSGALFPTRTVSADQTLYSEDIVTSIYENASPAVVELNVSQASNTGFFGRFTQEGEGSGFLIDKDKGYILTNNHVVEGATSVTVKLSTGKTLAAKVVGTDAIDDLALVSVDASAVSGITPLVLGDSSAVKPGQMAVAIGNPFGYQNSISLGIISGINRTISTSNYSGMLQTDAAINPGNSGGPLLNANGQVIGINTAIEAPSTGAQGIGFAVPANVAKNALSSLEAGKQVERPWIGIAGRALTSSLSETLKLSVDQGVYVVTVVAGGPADKAGLKGAATDDSGAPGSGGDVITAIDGKSVAGVPDLSTYINTKNVGDSVTLSIIRDGSSQSVEVTLGAKPANTGSTPQMPMPNFPNRGWRFNPGNSNND
jgi:S1-C subfamily serine protease